jgi:hypothetical protein
MTSIHDAFTKQIEPQRSGSEQRWTLLRYDDHILRRFGLAELIRSERSDFGEIRVREVADEVWVNLEGPAEFHLRDLRESSPTHGTDQIIRCDHPTLCLVPFGVGFAFRVIGEGCLFARLATHADDEQVGGAIILA